MSTSADLMVARADHARRLELAGVGPYDRRHHAEQRLDHGRPARRPGLASHPLAAFVARLVGRSGSVASGRPGGGGPVATGRPRHP